MFLVHAREKWCLQMMLARKYYSFTKSYLMLIKKIRFLLGMGVGGGLFALRLT